MKHSKLHKRAFAAAACLLMAFVLLTGCGGTSEVKPLPEGLDADTLITDAKTAIEAANVGDLDKLNEMLASPNVTAEEWEKQLTPILEPLGAFQDYGDITTTGASSQGVDYGVVVAEANYENGKAVYTIYFGTDGKMAGFWVKPA